jgi:hypothetical protein
MPRILYNPDTNTLITWPRADDDDVVGLQPPVVMLWIEQAEPPMGYDPAIYGLAPTQDVDLDALVLRRGWGLVELPPVVVAPTPRWVQFAQSLAGSDEIKALLWAIESVNPVLRDMMGVGLGQAAQGDPTTFLAAWSDAVTAGLVSPELAAQMQLLASGFDLPAEFVEGLG